MSVFLYPVAGRRWRSRGAKTVSGENLCQLQSVGKPVQAVISPRTDLQHSVSWLMLRQALRAVRSVLSNQDAAAMLYCTVDSQSVFDDLTFIHGQKGR